jgi:two-component system NtrC family sensor kinase
MIFPEHRKQTIMTTADGWPVLIIDDEKDIREVTALTLMDAGYRVETAADGTEGLARCEQFSPRIVITDIRMPGMDGIQVLETIKQRYPDTEVIVATAFGEMETAIRALQLDASDFITKPIHTEAMMVAIERARHRYRTRQQIKDYTRRLEHGLSRTTRQLEETVAYQNRLIESSMDGILGCDGDGRVVTFNRSMEQMLGIRPFRGAAPVHPDEFFQPSGIPPVPDDLAASGHGGDGRLMLYETCLLDHHQHPVPVQLSATVLMDEENTTGLVCFVRDLRRIHRLEQEMADQARLLHQDKMMSLGRLAASVAHEINNPLSGILNYIRLMLRSFRKGPLPTDKHTQFARYLELVETETDRCSKIVSSLLTFSRRSPVSVGPVSMAEIVDHSIVLARHIGWNWAMSPWKPGLRNASARNQRRRQPASAVPAQPDFQRGGCHARRRHPHTCRRIGREPRMCGRPANGYRPRHPRRGYGAHLRTVLHHQAGRPRHRPGAFDHLRYHPPPRRHPDGRQPAGNGDDLRNQAAGPNTQSDDSGEAA